MKKDNSKQILLEMMHKVTGMPLNENLNEFDAGNFDPDIDPNEPEYNKDNLDVTNIDYAASDLYQRTNDLNAVVREYHNQMGDILKHVSYYHGTDKADELYGIMEKMKSVNDSEALSDLMYEVNAWLYNNTDLQTVGGQNLNNIKK